MLPKILVFAGSNRTGAYSNQVANVAVENLGGARGRGDAHCADRLSAAASWTRIWKRKKAFRKTR